MLYGLGYTASLDKSQKKNIPFLFNLHTSTNPLIYNIKDFLKFTLKHLKPPVLFDHTIILVEHILLLAKVIY